MALPTEELIRFTPGQVAVGGGKMRDATMADFEYVNNAKIIHVMGGEGVVVGTKQASGNLKVLVSEQGPERDFFAMISKGSNQKLQYEIPTLNIEIEGVFNKLNGSIQVGTEVELSLSWVGILKSPVTV